MLGFFEYCYDLALLPLMQKKKNLNKFRPNFYENVRLLGKKQNFHARCGRFSQEPTFFIFCSKFSEGLNHVKKR
jgi:hypothetical protein